MFSNEDIRDIHQLFPPPANHLRSLPSLICASSGQEFITFQRLQADFEGRVTKETKRTPVADLAYGLDASKEVVLQLIRSHPHLALLSDDSTKVIPRSERDAISEKLRDSLSNGVLSKNDYVSQSKIDSNSLDVLLKDHEDQLVDYHGHVCSKAYEKVLSDAVLDSIQRAIDNMTNVEITSDDARQLPGSPPPWLILHLLKRLVQSQHLSDKVFIRETPTTIRCQAKQLKGNNVNAWARPLLAGELPYINLQNVLEKCPEIYDSLEDVQSTFRSLSDVEVVGLFAVSEPWLFEFLQSSMQKLHYTGMISIAQKLEQEFPEDLRGHVTRKVEQSIMVAIQQRPWSEFRYIRGFLVTGERYNEERNALLEHAGETATSQWRLLKDDRETEIKFDLSSIASATAEPRPFLGALIKEKAVEEAVEEQFWTTISEQEARNETNFATFWTERVVSRIHVYNEGLHSIEDPKLKDQLSDLLATYAQNELVPDTISRARSQGLILSRKTKKNVTRLEASLQAARTDIPTMISVIDKFNKKQSIETINISLENTKKTMVQDMLRRMQKQNKASDGPVLFLTLVVILFAKHHAGMVYATGKFAPKLMKQLKPALGPEQCGWLEKWKEAAKSGMLSAEDREEMRKMADA